jgi:hypothetical protein
LRGDVVSRYRANRHQHPKETSQVMDSKRVVGPHLAIGQLGVSVLRSDLIQGP